MLSLLWDLMSPCPWSYCYRSSISILDLLLCTSFLIVVGGCWSLLGTWWCHGLVKYFASGRSGLTLQSLLNSTRTTTWMLLPVHCSHSWRAFCCSSRLPLCLFPERTCHCSSRLLLCLFPERTCRCSSRLLLCLLREEISCSSMHLSSPLLYLHRSLHHTLIEHLGVPPIEFLASHLVVLLPSTR